MSSGLFGLFLLGIVLLEWAIFGLALALSLLFNIVDICITLRVHFLDTASDTLLFFLSLLHVILEFPLNITTIKEIGLECIKKLNLDSK